MVVLESNSLQKALGTGLILSDFGGWERGFGTRLFSVKFGSISGTFVRKSTVHENFQEFKKMAGAHHGINIQGDQQQSNFPYLVKCLCENLTKYTKMLTLKKTAGRQVNPVLQPETIFTERQRTNRTNWKKSSDFPI